MTTNQADYQTTSQKLDMVLSALQQPDVAVDEAVKLYEKGMKLVEQLEHHVANAENKLEKVRLRLNPPAEN